MQVNAADEVNRYGTRAGAITYFPALLDVRRLTAAVTWNPCPIQRRTGLPPGRFPSSRASTGSGIRTAG